MKVSLTLIFLFSEEENEVKAYLLMHFKRLQRKLKTQV